MTNFDELVESTLTAIEVEHAERNATIKVVDVNGVRWRICINGIEELLAEDFQLYNVLDRVTVYDDPERLDTDGLKLLYYLMNRVEPSQEDLLSGPTKAKVEQIKRERLKFLVFEPVYGAQILMLARDVVIQDFD